MSYRRGWVALLIFSVVVINYMDRVALSVAAKPIAAEFGLSPVAMGYLFSSFLWTYVICLIPIGLIVDRIGSKTIMGAGLALWSLATALTGLTWNLGSILGCRLCMGAGEATSYPAGARVIRDWIPEGERGQITTLFNSGAVAGPAVGAVFVAWLVSQFGWRPAFICLGILGLIWLAAWVVWFGPPERVSWLPAGERAKILAERHGRDIEDIDADTAQSSLFHILSIPTIWGLVLSQATIVYLGYLFLTWMPTYLQKTLHLSVFDTGLFTSIPYLGTLVLGLLIARISDKLLTPAAVRSGGRRYYVVSMMAFGLLVLTASMITNTALLLVVITVVVTASNTASAFNLTMVNDLTENPRDAPRVMSCVVFGGNACGLIAPIVTGYVVQVTGGFDWAFRIASALLVVGMVLSLTLSRGRIPAQHVSPRPAMREATT
ncbi:MAG TPA: MFS transporter [Rhodopila sp.]|uniref:MFS transporter n=1 Tax=Rhodopila sp. TaxID=2480087 RepID=UPI002BEC80A3|nr:MFS transporter [Rhodopila sp.]HVY17188.1 MFS transporter [Rhodopila sp.]